MGIEKSGRNERIIVAYNNGATIAMLSEELGVTRQRIQQILKRSNVTMRRRGKPRKERFSIDCRQCGKNFESLVETRVFCSRRCTHLSIRKYRTPKEKRAAKKAKMVAARERANRYYYEVFKKRSDWRNIVRERNNNNKVNSKSNVRA